MPKNSNYGPWNFETNSRKFIGPPYPNLGAEVEKWRRVARRSELTARDRQLYGDAVDKAMRDLQRKELENYCRRGKQIMGEVPRIQLTTIGRLFRYSRPNPFRMVGDPVERSEETLYAHALAFAKEFAL